MQIFKKSILAVLSALLLTAVASAGFTADKKSKEVIQKEMAGLMNKYVDALTQAFKEKEELGDFLKTKNIFEIDVNSVSKSKLKELISRYKKLRSSHDEALQHINDLMALGEQLDAPADQLKRLKTKQDQAISLFEQADIKITSIIADAQRKL